MEKAKCRLFTSPKSYRHGFFPNRSCTINETQHTTRNDRIENETKTHNGIWNGARVDTSSRLLSFSTQSSDRCTLLSMRTLWRRQPATINTQKCKKACGSHDPSPHETRRDNDCIDAIAFDVSFSYVQFIVSTSLLLFGNRIRKTVEHQNGNRAMFLFFSFLLQLHFSSFSGFKETRYQYKWSTNNMIQSRGAFSRVFDSFEDLLNASDSSNRWIRLVGNIERLWFLIAKLRETKYRKNRKFYTTHTHTDISCRSETENSSRCEKLVSTSNHNNRIERKNKHWYYCQSSICTVNAQKQRETANTTHRDRQTDKIWCKTQNGENEPKWRETNIWYELKSELKILSFTYNLMCFVCATTLECICE